MTIAPIIGLLAGASMTAAIISAPPSIPCMCFAIIPLIAISHELYTTTLLFHLCTFPSIYVLFLALLSRHNQNNNHMSNLFRPVHTGCTLTYSIYGVLRALALSSMCRPVGEPTIIHKKCHHKENTTLINLGF